MASSSASGRSSNGDGNSSSNEFNVNISQLTTSQQQALEQFISVTSSDPVTSIPLLQRSQWNVQIAISKFFDGDTADPVAEVLSAQQDVPLAPSASSSSSARSRLSGRSSIHRRNSDISPAPRVTANGPTTIRRTPLILAILFLPFQLVYKLLGGAFNLFAILFPFLRPLQRSLSQGSNQRRSTKSPRDTAARFIREFEEQTGVKDLPWFEGGYAQAMDLAKKDIRFFMVVLQSDEHDDTAVFNKETLGNPEVVRWIKDNNIVLWGGSVSDSEGYQVSNSLSTTAFPFVALIALTPPSSSSPSSSSTNSSSSSNSGIPTTMSTISRISGLLPPQTLLSKLSAAVSTHNEALNRIRTQRATQLADRRLREQQNSAYEASLARDRERARLRREEEERRRAAEEAERRRQEDIELSNRRKCAWKRNRVRRGLPVEPKDGGARLSIRFPDGERVIRKFDKETKLEELYTWVECRDVDISGSTNEQEVQDEELLDGYTHSYGFRLVSPMPRKVFELGVESTVASSGLWPSGNLIVEEVDEEDGDEAE